MFSTDKYFKQSYLKKYQNQQAPSHKWRRKQKKQVFFDFFKEFLGTWKQQIFQIFFLLSKWQKKKKFLLNFRGAAPSTLQSAQTERVWRRQGLILNIEQHFPHTQQWADQEVTLGLTERLRQHVAHCPQPRSAFQQSDQRFMAKLSSLHLNCKSTAKKKRSHGPGCILNQRRARWGGEKLSEAADD